jgi:hypothetical protein
MIEETRWQVMIAVQRNTPAIVDEAQQFSNFFQLIHLGGEPTDLGIQLLDLLDVGSFGGGPVVVLLKDERQPIWALKPKWKTFSHS